MPQPDGDSEAAQRREEEQWEQQMMLHNYVDEMERATRLFEAYVFNSINRPRQRAALSEHIIRFIEDALQGKNVRVSITANL